MSITKRIREAVSNLSTDQKSVLFLTLISVVSMTLALYLKKTQPLIPPSISPAIRSALEEIHESKILFNPPHEMEQGKLERVEARISYKDVGDAIIKNLKGRGKPELENIQVGQKMSVTLYYDEDDFKVKSYNSKEQVVIGRPYAQWEWDVTPIDYGEKQLHLKAVLNLDDIGKDSTPYDIPVIDRTINIKVNPAFIAEQAAKNKDTRDLLIGSGSVLGAIGLIYAGFKGWRSRKKKKEEEKNGRPWESA